MAEYSAGLVALAERLQAKSADLEPQLQEIGKLEGQVPSGGMRVGVAHRATLPPHEPRVNMCVGVLVGCHWRSEDAKRTLQMSQIHK